MIHQIRAMFPNTLAQAEKSTSYGQRDKVDIIITGQNGKRGTFRTVWEYDDGSTPLCKERHLGGS